MEKQLAWSLGFVVQPVRFDVLLNVTAQQPDLAVFDLGVRFGQRTAPFTQAFHLAAHQDDAALERVEDDVVVPRFAVLADDLQTVLLRVFLFVVVLFGSRRKLTFSTRAGKSGIRKGKVR